MKSVIIAPLDTWVLIYPLELEKWETLPALASCQEKKRGISQGSLKYCELPHPVPFPEYETGLNPSGKEINLLMEGTISLQLHIPHVYILILLWTYSLPSCVWENHPSRATVGCDFGKFDLYLCSNTELH